MKYVLFYEAATDLGKARELFPEHRARWEEYRANGTLLMIGPFTEREQGAMGVFTTQRAAEEFVEGDPFVLRGVVSSWRIQEWNEVIA